MLFISDNNKFEFGFSNQTDTGNALQLKSVIVTPVNSLRNHIDKWKSIEANQYILNVILATVASSYLYLN
jgi:hypothetical protein